jgi:hypothetical protein
MSAIHEVDGDRPVLPQLSTTRFVVMRLVNGHEDPEVVRVDPKDGQIYHQKTGLLLENIEGRVLVCGRPTAANSTGTARGRRGECQIAVFDSEDTADRQAGYWEGV